jgi:hypothetical protein
MAARLLERHARRHGHEVVASDVFGEGTEARTEHLVARSEVRDARADRLHGSRRVDAKRGLLRCPEPIARPNRPRLAAHAMPVEGIDRCGPDPHEHRVGGNFRPLDLGKLEEDDILSGIVDLVVGEIELPPPDTDWRAAIRRSAISAHDVLVSHPWSAGLVLSGPGISMARMRQMNAILGRLRQAGFSAEMTDHAYHALDSHIMGFTLWQVGMNLGSDQELAALASAALEQISAQELPHLVEHIDEHLKPRVAQDEGEFAFGLDLILDGLERQRTAR